MDHSHHHQHLNFDPSSLDPLAWAGFAAIFSYSFLSSLHCIGMCGPLACSVLSRQSPRWALASILYNSGRIFSYTATGALVGLLSQGLTTELLGSGKVLGLILGCALIISAMLQLFPNSFRLMKPRFGSKAISGLQQKILSWPPAMQSFGLGLITVFLPCMTLHPMLLAAAGTQSALSGGLSLFAFALGTLPAMLSATYVPSLLPRRANSHFLAKIGPLFLIIVGFLTIWRAFGASH